MTLVCETVTNGRLWLGGEKAVHDSVLLSENEVGYVWPACKSAMFESPNVCVLDTVDGTALRMGMFLGTES